MILDILLSNSVKIIIFFSKITKEFLELTVNENEPHVYVSQYRNIENIKCSSKCANLKSLSEI